MEFEIDNQSPEGKLLTELKHLRTWDMLDSTPDGQAKKEQIDKCIEITMSIAMALDMYRDKTFGGLSETLCELMPEDMEFYDEEELRDRILNPEEE